MYLERFQMFVSVNNVPEQKQVPLFLTVIGGHIWLTPYADDSRKPN